MTADVTGSAGAEGSEPAPRRPPSVAPALSRPGPALDGRPDPAPVHFQQLVNGAWLHWSVVEADARAVPGAPRLRCLVFTRQDCIRRVWDYPADWRALDEAGLAALSWHR